MHAEHVPLSATAKRLRLRRLRLGVTRGVGAAMASCTWSDEETFVLIEIWEEDSIQAMLEGTRRNKDVFVKIAKAIEARGFLRAILYTYYVILLRMRNILTPPLFTLEPVRFVVFFSFSAKITIGIAIIIRQGKTKMNG